MKLTELEKVVIRTLAKNEYSDDPGDPVWTFIIEDNTDLHSKQISGVVSSLTKKGLVDSNDDGKDSTVWLTENGVEEYHKLKVKK